MNQKVVFHLQPDWNFRNFCGKWKMLIVQQSQKIISHPFRKFARHHANGSHALSTCLTNRCVIFSYNSHAARVECVSSYDTRSACFFFLLISPLVFETKTLNRRVLYAASTEINHSSLHRSPLCVLLSTI